MSQRHRTADVPSPIKQELRAQAHGERHRIHVELQEVGKQLSSGLDPADVHEPGAAWKPVHHKDAEVAKEQVAKRNRTPRHWKLKMWKRRTATRSAKAHAMRLAGEL
jgi:hypothetical protein